MHQLPSEKYLSVMMRGTQAVTSAPEIAAAAGQQIVEPEHLLKALLEQVGIACVVLTACTHLGWSIRQLFG